MASRLSYGEVDESANRNAESPPLGTSPSPQMTSSKPKHATLEECRDEIYRLYISENKSGKEVRAILKQDFGLDVSPKMLNTRLARWGYTKNLKRVDMRRIMQAKARRDAEGKTSTFVLRGRLVDLDDIERKSKRAGVLQPHASHALLPDEARNALSTGDLVCRTPSPALPWSLPNIQQWRAPEKLLVDVDALIRGMFEAKHWRPNGYDLLIRSSWAQTSESTTLEQFRANLNSGSDAAQVADFPRAFGFWGQAFMQVEALVQAEYHDVIPNFVQRINDLNEKGHWEIAAKLKDHIAACSKSLSRANRINSSRLSILGGLGEVDMAYMVDIEEKMLQRFKELFEDELYLGVRYYNSFVMMINTARRRLQRSSWITFDECLPALKTLDGAFGPSDRRTLDVICLRVETLLLRGLAAQSETEAIGLIGRANAIQNDEWQRFYNLTRGYYFLGCAQFALGKREESVQTFWNALRFEGELAKLNDFGIFTGEKVRIKNYLEALSDENWNAGAKQSTIDTDIHSLPADSFRDGPPPVEQAARSTPLMQRVELEEG